MASRPSKKRSNLDEALRVLQGDAYVADQPDDAPELPQDHATILNRLRAIEGTLPPLYEYAVYNPFLSSLAVMGSEQFSSLVDRNCPEQGMRNLVIDVAQSLLQYGEGYKAKATDAAQEVVSDLFDGFLSAADRRGVSLPDQFTAAPLVKWGSRGIGPYVFPSHITGLLGLGAGVVNLPPVYARRGLAAWATLPHEVAGHEIFRADRGVRLEIAKTAARWIEKDVKPAKAVAADQGINYFLAQYLSQRVDEAAADVLGILNMGPAALLALIAYFRADNGGTLNGDADDEHLHPPAFLRALIMLEAIELVELSKARRDRWIKEIKAELLQDENSLSSVRGAGRCLIVGKRPVRLERAREAARSFARAVVVGRLEALDGASFGFIQNWREIDEDIVDDLAENYFPPDSARQLAEGETNRVFAAHAVAAAVVHVNNHPAADLQSTFGRMLDLLEFMHQTNPVWNGVATLHRSNIVGMSSHDHDHAQSRRADDRHVRFVERGAYEPKEFTTLGRMMRGRPNRRCASAPQQNASNDGRLPSVTTQGFDRDGGNSWGFAPGGVPCGFAPGGGVPWGFTQGGGVPWGFAQGGGVPWGFTQGGGVPWGFAQGGGVPWGFTQGGGVRHGFASGGGVPWGFASGGGVPWGFAGFDAGGGIPLPPKPTRPPKFG